MKMRNVLPALAAGLGALVLIACTLDSDPAITKAEYKGKNTFLVCYRGGSGTSPDFTVEGKDKTYSIKSYTSITLFDNTEASCVIDGQFISSDRVTVTSSGLPGSAWFDVPDYEE
jgi:hypothetical protein